MGSGDSPRMGSGDSPRVVVADTQGRTQSATGGDPSRLEKAGRSRICLSVDGKHLKADCGFGLDHSKSSDALLLRCSDAEVGQDRASGVA